MYGAEVEIENIKRRCKRFLDAILEIEKLVHIPTPQGTKAYTHFMRDFDQIRKICRETKTLPPGM